ncbi:hypothetical protein vseg_021676 [Gypsophila vaccaria]
MEFVGKSVFKEFLGFGVIQSFDSSTGLYRILYENGDFEKVDSPEVSLLLSNSSKLSGNSTRSRRRNCVIDPGKFDDDGNLVENLENNVDVNSHLNVNDLANDSVNYNIDVNVGVNVGDCGGGGDGNVNVNVGGGLDLNRGFEVDEGNENGRGLGYIDLNVSVENGDFGENGVGGEKAGSLDGGGGGGGGGGEEGRKERGFDLNLGFDDEGANGVSVGMDVEGSGGSGEGLGNGVDSGNGGSDGNDGQLEGGVLEGGTPVVFEDGNSGRRKRRKVRESLSSPAKTVLRRSARRAKVAAFAESMVPSAMVEDGGNDVSVSGITEELEVKPAVRRLKKVVEPEVPPSKIDLPPSSATFNLEGIPVVDLFTVYSCLRSFSTLLYLSPFDLGDFVTALKSTVSNRLIDCIHMSVLQTLRKHLEALANEGCESASTCLRNLNWDLLDEITWPVFMVEYLLIHCSSLKPGFNLNQLKLFDGGYYKQPEDVKIELLRCLCDDVVEVEVIRSEVTRRRITTVPNTDVDRTLNSDSCGKRKISTDASGDFHLSEDVEDADGNSDECCLCKMDGNLICCDGCPAAYHSKCVGIVSSLLPEGDWFCPECAISRHSAGCRPQKSFQGAKLLGIDPYGRLFFSCFDYLLVSDSYEADSAFSYYHKDDLKTVSQILESSGITYASILGAIFQNWVIPTVFDQLESDMKSDCTLKVEDSIARNPKSSINGCLNHLGIESSESPDGLKYGTVTEKSFTNSEPDEVVLQADEALQNSDRPPSDVIARGTLAKRISASKRKKKDSVSMQTGSSNVKAKEDDGLVGVSGYGYNNSYKFGRTAASVVEELLHKPSDKVSANTVKTQEEIISIQLKIIMKKSTKCCWDAIQQLNEERQKEKCGWCYCCRFSVEDKDCLFNINKSSIPESLKADIDGILSERNKKGHLVDIICYILYMEERLRGLLLGPWLSPQYSDLWRKRVLQACDVSSLKHLLLTLESNLHPLTLTTEWSKPVDSVATMGSASHFVSKSRVNSKNGINKKKGRSADGETKSPKAGSGLSLFWWRGGWTSRSLFNWKVIPHSAALRAARKGGSIKIPDILYSDSLENSKRSKFAAWRAAVEASKSIEQLALQVRELDLVIRWDDIENTLPHFLMDKETIKSMRLFKKAIIRRKCVEGAEVKYLVDFGKRRNIPEVVIKHGVKLEDSDSERKKYWLNEPFVPLYLIKIFEERRVIRKAGKIKSSPVRKGGKKKARKISEEKGFEYLFARAAMADNYQCGHCNKNIPDSEAVSCQLCSGFFHKKHVKMSSEGSTAGSKYTCYKCQAGKQIKSEKGRGRKKLGKLLHAKKLKVGRKAMSKAKLNKDGKTLLQYHRRSLRNATKLHNNDQLDGIASNNHQQPLAVKHTNVSVDVVLRRSARTAKCVSVPVKPDVLVGARKRKRNKNFNSPTKRTPKTPVLKKRRTRVFHSFWINGLRLSRKPKDERVVDFKKKRLCVAFESSGGTSVQPKCSLCLEQAFKPSLMYVACDICEAWFHGEAFGLNRRNIKSIIGFKCHACRETSAPNCPFAGKSRDYVATSVAATNEAQGAQASPKVIIQMEIDVSEKCRSRESSLSLPESTHQKMDGISNHNKAPPMDSDAVSKLIESPKESEANTEMNLDENNVLHGNDIKLTES